MRVIVYNDSSNLINQTPYYRTGHEASDDAQSD